jgi:Zn-dependent peptidase ImmA (M78 family)/DNA-binding XRE family transcriptional regulator
MGSLLSPEMNEAYITGDVLTWAIERTGLSRDELARRIKVTVKQIEAWEREDTRPPFGKAEELANALKIPFGYFYFSSRPSEDVPLPDFRTIDEFARRKLSADAIDHINNVVLKYEWYKEYADEESLRHLGFVGRFSTTDDPDDIANDIIGALRIPEVRASSKNWSQFLSKLIAIAEKSGILVIRTGIVKSSTRRTLMTADFRGFAIGDPVAPIVFINANDSVAARIFTLMHEVAHVWLGKSGISNSDGTESKATLAIEKLCNAVAVRALVPLEDFDNLWNRFATADNRIDKLARSFKVSSIVIIRRAHETGKLTYPEFLDLVREARANLKPVRKPKGGDPERNMRARNSGPLTDAVIKYLRKGRLIYRDAARLLGVSVPYIASISEKGAIQ